jgi:hypothetical protein
VQDPALFGSENLEKLMEIYLPQISRSGAVLKMPGTLVENINCADGSYHDNRPQLFATGLLQYSMVGRGLWRMGLGIAVRANRLLQRIEGYAWLGRELTVEFAGEGTHVAAIDIAGRRLERTLQIPDDLPPGQVRIIARLSDTPPARPQLIYSTMRLLGAEEDGAAAIYTFEAIGKNVAAFTAPWEEIELTAPDGAAIEPETAECFSWHVIEFPGRGRFVLRVW